MEITKDMINAAFDQGLAVFHNEKSFAEAVGHLTESFGFNAASANDYTRNLSQLLNGEKYQRTLSIAGTRIFLQRIKDELPPKYLGNAITSIEAHLDYYEQLRNVRMTGQRNLIAEFKPDQDVTFHLHTTKEIESELLDRVQKSAKDTSAERRTRLAQATKTAQQIKVTTEVYQRNPDVIAEALYRAQGVCEFCKSSAPFTRKSTNTPYLEVHHRIPLSEGGEDTLQNAIALCPNCHREAHFGTNWKRFRQ